MLGGVFLTLLLLSLQVPDLVWCVRLVELRVPTHEREGGRALLGCQFDMEGEVLYSVKWYKDGNEFYRYVPKNRPPNQDFKRPGVTVDMARSSSTVVTLVNLTHESSGLYSCEVSGEGPDFTTVTSHKFITIHLLPETGPRLTGLQEEYNVDDLVRANCTSPASRPAAHLEWQVNGQPVPIEFLRGPWRRVSPARPDAEQTILELSFTTVPADFIDGALRFKCQATIAPLYQRETYSTHYVRLPFISSTPDSEATQYENVSGYAGILKFSIFTLILPTAFVLILI